MVDIRPSQPEDAARLEDLDRSTWTSLSSPAPPPGPDWRFFDAKTKPEDVLIALVDCEVVGYVRLGRPTPLGASDHVVTINGLAVGPRYRRRGVGRTLVAAAVEAARARRARRLTLRVLGHNVAARRLYESAGFVVEGRLRGEFFLDGAYVDDIFMALDLQS